MPRLLRVNSIRLLEAACHSLDLALSALAYKTRTVSRVQEVERAPAVALTGAAAELAMSACLVQVHGQGALLAAENRFKTGRQILHDFRRLVRQPVPATDFLVQGVRDPAAHRETLLDATTGFTTLLGARAAAIHGGHGLSREVCLELAGTVSTFLQRLANSTKIRPYLDNVPAPPPHRPDRAVLVDDLARAVTGGTDVRAGVVALYLLLPEVTEDEPDWLDAFDRVTVTPTQTDIDLLIRHLQRARPVVFQRAVRGGGTTLPVTHQPDVPGAVPVGTHRMRSMFRDPRDQWYAAAGLANGRLEDRRLELPEKALVIDVFRAAIAGGLDDPEDGTAHRIWPLTLAARKTQGVVGPTWFLLRRCDDLGQLQALVRRAAALGSEFVQRRTEPLLDDIQALRQGHPLLPDNPLVTELRATQTAADRHRERLAQRLDTPRAPTNEEARRILAEVAAFERPVGEAVERLLEDAFGLEETQDARYWARLLAEAAADVDDVPALVDLLGDPNYTQAHTAARKAIRLIDLLTHGPEIEGAEEE